MLQYHFVSEITAFCACSIRGRNSCFIYTTLNGMCCLVNHHFIASLELDDVGIWSSCETALRYEALSVIRQTKYNDGRTMFLSYSMNTSPFISVPQSPLPVDFNSNMSSVLVNNTLFFVTGM